MRRLNSDEAEWKRERSALAVTGELPVKAFFDSNGDGIGDFPGLCNKLDYLADLGVTCVWLLPFFPSPLRLDNGSDWS